MCPTGVPPWATLTGAACMHPGDRVSADHARAREKVDSLGTAETRHQPNGRRGVGPYLSLPPGADVVGRSRTALSAKARPGALRSEGGCPTPRWSWCRCRSTSVRPETATNLRCVLPGGPTSPGGGGEKFPPEAVPCVRYGSAHGHGAVSLYVAVQSPSSYRRDGSISRPAGQEKARFREKTARPRSSARGSKVIMSMQISLFSQGWGKKYLSDAAKEEVDSRNLRDSGTESDRTDVRNCFYPFIVSGPRSTVKCNTRCG